MERRRPPLHFFVAEDQCPGFFASNLMVFRTIAWFDSSVAPAGYLFALRTKARISAFCWPLKLPGAFWGIEIRMRSNKSPRVRPSQPDRKSPVASGGAI